VVEPNIGFRGFYAGPHVHIIDPLALTDPLLARLPALRDPRWRVGHYLRAVPDGYVQTLNTGTCQMRDPALCEYWQTVRLVTSGELWSWARVRAALALQLGRYDHLIDEERYRRGEPERENLERLSLPIDERRLDRGLRAVGERGLLVELGRTAHAESLALAVSRGDRFELLFEGAGQALGRVEVDAADDVIARALQVPRSASRAGFDRVEIRPLGGDGWYGAGALWFGGEPVWASKSHVRAPD
jgi:arabinofuranosyltransferase